MRILTDNKAFVTRDDFKDFNKFFIENPLVVAGFAEAASADDVYVAEQDLRIVYRVENLISKDILKSISDEELKMYFIKIWSDPNSLSDLKVVMQGSRDKLARMSGIDICLIVDYVKGFGDNEECIVRIEYTRDMIYVKKQRAS